MSNENPAYYAVIPANVRYDKNLNPNAKLLYGEITALCNKNGFCWASNNYFAELYGVSKDSITRWLANLVKYGYISMKITYKEDSKEVESRQIYINAHADTVTAEIQVPSPQKCGYPHRKNADDNSTSNNNTINTISKDIENTQPAKTQKPTKKERIEDINKMFSMIKDFTAHEEIRTLLNTYLKWRLQNSKNFNSTQWSIMLTQLREHTDGNASEAIALLQSAIGGGYRNIIPSWELNKKKISKKASFDNTADGRELPKPVAQMNDDERKEFEENELARDEDGNLIVF